MPKPTSRASVSGADWLTWPETRQIFDVLGRDGEVVRAVGGAVRDALLGRDAREVDMATTALPAKVIELAQAGGLKSVPTGIDHGTVTVVAEGRPFEVTTLRKDVETDGRRAKIGYTDDWHADASRRDFTINALYADADGQVFDPLNALDDVSERRVRFIGDADERVREDYLRILRFFRFNAELDLDRFDAAGLRACVRGRAGLDTLSAERVQGELFRILKAPGARGAVAALFDNGLLVSILGGVPQVSRFNRLLDIKMQFQVEPDPVLRLAALALWVPEDAARLFERFRLSNAERARLEAASEFRNIALATFDGPIQWGLYRRGREDFLRAALLAWAHSGASAGDPDWRAMIARISDEPIPVFPLTGDDIKALGVAEGPEIGDLLNALEVHWMSEGFTVAKEDLLAVARELTPEASAS